MDQGSTYKEQESNRSMIKDELGKKGDSCPDCKKPVSDRWGTGHGNCTYSCPDCGEYGLPVKSGHFGWSPVLTAYCHDCFHDKYCGPRCTFGKCERKRTANEKI